MNRVFMNVSAIILLACGHAFAQNPDLKTKPPGKEVPSASGEWVRVQQQILDQQARIVELERQLSQRGLELQQHEQQILKLQSFVEQQTAAAEKTASRLEAMAAIVKADVDAAPSVRETEKALKDLEHPAALHYKGVALTPGGFLDATFIGRSRNMNSDVISNFGYFPFDGVANSSLSEFRMSARASRASLLVEGNVGGAKLSGFFELDFLGQAPTANQIETNSFNPRQRQLWAQVELNHGVVVTAGQMWSLLTTHRKGIGARAEFIPSTIEGSYVSAGTMSGRRPCA